eukprot:m.222803 g.222803  ORF g.222803 m.222803 type:complete len:343 (+) comp32928_c0_seq1:298-1326(+)
MATCATGRLEDGHRVTCSHEPEVSAHDLPRPSHQCPPMPRHHLTDSHSHVVGPLPPDGTMDLAHVVVVSVDEEDWVKVLAHVSDGSTAADNGACHVHVEGEGMTAHDTVTLSRTLDQGTVPPHEARRPHSQPIMHCTIGLGIHPWRAHAVAPGWSDRLAALLTHNPRAIVGEIGLDKAARTPETHTCEIKLQRDVFHTQLALAGRMARPVSVHCVRAVGAVFDAIASLAKEGGAPPVVAMHSYTGSVEFIPRFLALEVVGVTVYFGFSTAVNATDDRRLEHVRACLGKVPRSRVLLESDLSDATAAGSAVRDMARHIAKVWGVDEAEVAAVTGDNCRRAFDL